MVSELAKAINFALASKGLIVKHPYELPSATALRAVRAIDAQLAEVRAVLSLTADRRYPIDSHGHCWCTKDLTDDKEPHGEFCQRARALYERLRIK
jgi:hypothetical protein